MRTLTHKTRYNEWVTSIYVALPKKVYDIIEKSAKENLRSMSAEISFRLQQGMTI
jgi:hypothetical protein